MYNPVYIDMMRHVQNLVEPAIWKILTGIKEAWGLTGSIQTYGGPLFNSGWFIEDRYQHIGIAILINWDSQDDWRDLNCYHIELRRPDHSVPAGFSPFSPEISTFPLTSEGFAQLIDFLNLHNPSNSDSYLIF